MRMGLVSQPSLPCGDGEARRGQSGLGPTWHASSVAVRGGVCAQRGLNVARSWWPGRSHRAASRPEGRARAPDSLSWRRGSVSLTGPSFPGETAGSGESTRPPPGPPGPEPHCSGGPAPHAQSPPPRPALAFGPFLPRLHIPAVVLDTQARFSPGPETAAQTLPCPPGCRHRVPAPGVALSTVCCVPLRGRLFLLITMDFSGQGPRHLAPRTDERHPTPMLIGPALRNSRSWKVGGARALSTAPALGCVFSRRHWERWRGGGTDSH